MCDRNNHEDLAGHEAGFPDKEVLLKALELEWQDFIQTRRQTWRTLEIEGALIVGLIGADFKFNEPLIAFLIGILVIIATLSGSLITIHHRRGQILKYEHINRLEKALGLQEAGLIDNVHLPEEFKWLHLVNPTKWNTPLFILRMHFAMMIFTIIYMYGVRFKG